MTNKILILHDTFLYRGGGERLVLMMANSLDADIASGFFSPGSYNLREQGFKGEMIPLMPGFFLHEFTWMPKQLAFVFKNGLRHFGLKWAFSMNAKKLQENYDTIILSGDCISAVDHFKEKNILYYCHTIPRYLFDQQEAYEKKVPKLMLYTYKILTDMFRKSYLRDLAHVPKLLTNSKNTQKRIKIFTGRDAEILYPPVDTQFFSPSTKYQVFESVRPGVYRTVPSTGTEKEYFLSFARLSSIKRVDRIVMAFQQMPDKNLIITYGKNDPEKQKIMDMIKDFPNIEMRQSPSDDELRELIRGATATIYVPVDEDFGMSPVESMSCGTPVIGVNDGGLKESIVDGKTGILIDKKCSPEDIMEAVKTLKKTPELSQACIERANDFSLDSFQKQLKESLNLN